MRRSGVDQFRLSATADVATHSVATMTIAPPCRRTILVIDDDPDVREVMQRQLATLGFDVVVAPNGLDGLIQLEQTQPDLVLCDLSMPVMGGLEFARRMRRDPRNRDVRLIAVTGYKRETNLLDRLSVGFDAYVLKPIARESLARLVRRQLRVGREMVEFSVDRDSRHARARSAGSVRGSAGELAHGEDARVSVPRHNVGLLYP
jgi:CheY-like chemotaxis protein